MHRPFATEVATKSSTTQHTFIKLLFSLFTQTQKLVCTCGEGGGSLSCSVLVTTALEWRRSPRRGSFAQRHRQRSRPLSPCPWHPSPAESSPYSFVHPWGHHKDGTRLLKPPALLLQRPHSPHLLSSPPPHNTHTTSLSWMGRISLLV